MGLNQNESGTGATYLSIINGKLIQKVQEGTEGAVSRVNKVGATVWEREWASISATLITAYKRTHPEYGDSVAIVMEDGDDRYIITGNVTSNYIRDFLMKIPNLKWGETTRLKPFQFADKDNPSKIIRGMTIEQDGKKVEKGFTRENPNGLPELEKKKIKGKETWDDSERIEFLLGLLPEPENEESPF